MTIWCHVFSADRDLRLINVCRAEQTVRLVALSGVYQHGQREPESINGLSCDLDQHAPGTQPGVASPRLAPNGNSGTERA